MKLKTPHISILNKGWLLCINLLLYAGITRANHHTENLPADTTSKSKTSLQIDRDSAVCISEFLLNNHPVFLDHWNNEETFVFEEVNFEDLPDEIVIPLVQKDEKFNLTWYGKINSTYKKRWGRQHHGLDIHLKTGDSVVAAFDGVVRYAQLNKAGFGNCVVIRHINGLETVYGHLSKLLVKPNEFVSSGQLIGLGGSTGHSQGPHLHFETRYKDFSFNPEYYIDLNTQQLKSNTLILHKNDFTAYRYRSDKNRNSLTEPSEKEDNQTTFNTTSGEYLTGLDSTEFIKNDSLALNDTKDILTDVESEAKTTYSIKTTTTKAFPLKNSKVISKKNPPLASKKTTNKSKTVSKKNTAKGGKSYEIQKGDNLTVIAKKTGVPISKLRKMNVIKSDFKLMPGQKLKIH